MEKKLYKRDFEWLDKEIGKTRNMEEYYDEEMSLKEYLDDTNFEEWIEELEKNILEIYKKSKITKDADLFKEEILLNEEYSWAITSHGQLQKKIKNAPAHSLFSKVDGVISDYEKGNRNLDDLVLKGKIPNIMGEATVTEWLHRFYPDFCPMKNKRNHFFISSIPSLATKDIFSMSITDFAEYSDIIGKYIGEKLDISNHFLGLAERLAWIYSIDSENEEAFSEFYDPRFEKES